MRQISQQKLDRDGTNFCTLNDFKEGDKIVFKAQVNEPNNEIRVILLL